MTARTTADQVPAPAPTPAAALSADEVAVRFERVTAMIEAGNPRSARREVATLAAAADDATAGLLTACLQALERHPKVGIPLLRRLWRDSDADGRALIEACRPREPALALPNPVPAHPRRRDRARGPVHQHVTRQGPARGTRGRAGADQARDAHRYFARDAEAGGVDALTEDPDSDTRHLDYPGWVDDEAPALVPTRGTPCVSCWIERPTAEQRDPDDDGLCAECRDRGEVGITYPHSDGPGADRAGRLLARVAHIAGRAATREQARSLLRGEYFRARGADRALIVAWVHQHLPA